MPKKSKPAIPKPYPLPKITVPVFCEENGFYTTKQRSYNMSQIKGKDTKPEKSSKKPFGMQASGTAATKETSPASPISP